VLVALPEFGVGGAIVAGGLPPGGVFGEFGADVAGDALGCPGDVEVEGELDDCEPVGGELPDCELLDG
jgi:hypothetical protein